MASESHVGSLLRSWRDARGMSQERLAARAGVSTRHLSFIETGRSSPGKDVLLALAGALEVPLRDQNSLLLAAGLAPRYATSSLDGSELSIVRRALDHVLRQQEPFPAIVVDRLWNVLRLNQGAQRMLAAFLPPNMPADVAGNAMLALVHPDGWKPFIVDWDDLAGHLVERLHRELAASPRDAQLAELLARVLGQPGVPAHWHKARLAASVRPFAAVHLRRGALELRMFTMLTTLGTPLDVTAEELRIETYFPADDATESVLRSWAA
ncbi:MAG TPA: helix-turn-helix transcriptional regulator [Kofleriaceae bacterium]|nr:helix-turn-helix transcriptional regulator [Kofleriaceae bacterium]